MMILLFAIIPCNLALAVGPLPASKGVVSFELDGVLLDSDLVRQGVRAEMQGWLRERLSHSPLDVYEQFDLLKKQGEDYGFMMPGIQTVMMESLKTVVAAAGVEEHERGGLVEEGLGVWLSAHSGFAELQVAPQAVTALEALRAAGFGCCAITSSVGDTDRLPSLAPLVDFTLSMYDFTVGYLEAWDVAFQVGKFKYEQGVPWVHVGGAVEGGLAPAGAAGLLTVGLGDATTLEGTPTRCISSLDELPEAVASMCGV